MAVYKKNLLKTFYFRIYASMPLIVDVFILIYFGTHQLDYTYIYISVIFLLMLHLVPLIAFIQFNFVIVEKDELIVGNGVYTFLKRRYRKDNIVKVLIGQGAHSIEPYIQIFTPQKKSRKFMLILVSRADLKKIVSHLEELNFPVEFDLNK